MLDLPEGVDLGFRAGAFIQVTAPAYELSYADLEVAPAHEPFWTRFDLRKLRSGSPTPVTRAYSIANTPADKGRIVLLVRLALPPPSQSAPMRRAPTTGLDTPGTRSTRRPPNPATT